ncbi:MAG: peptidase [Peptococcaceae bacterium]|nr:peptidase [Peptococcaceae bacterium]
MYRKKLQLALKELENEAIATLQKAVQIPSITGEEENVQRFLEGILKDMGLETDLWYPNTAELKEHPAFDLVNHENLGKRPNLVGRLRGTGKGKSLILNGHVDVVDPGTETHWVQKNPWSGLIEDGKLYGRGACDMKSGLLAGIFAVKALIKSGLPINGDILLESVISEEDGGCGTLACLARGYTAAGAVVMEPTKMSLMPAQLGATSFRLTVTGLATHGCVRYQGVSAIEKFSFLHQGIIEWEKAREEKIDWSQLFSGYPIKAPISIGTIQAGNWDSTVAEKLTAEGRLGVFLNQSLKDARNSFEDMIADLSAQDPWLAENPPKIEWFQAAWEPAAIDPDHPLVMSLKKSYETTLGRQAVLEGAPYGSDMRLLTIYGNIPTVIFGPGDVANAHFTNEFVLIKEYLDTIAVLADLIYDWCNNQ